MFLCDYCGCEYEWEMFYNNHMRSIHKSKVGVKPRAKITLEQYKVLSSYFKHMCDHPTLNEIKELGEILGLKKETIYWWFFNERKTGRRGNGGQKSHKRRASDDATDRKKEENSGETSNEGGTSGITSDRKSEKRGRLSKKNTTGKGTATL